MDHGLSPHRLRNIAALRFDDWPIRRAAYPLFSFLIPLIFLHTWSPFPWVGYGVSCLVSFVHTLAYWEGNRWIFIQMLHRYPAWQQLWPRLWRQVGLMLGYSGAVAIFFYYLSHAIIGKYTNGAEDYTLQHSLWLGFATTIGISSFYESAYFFQRWKDSMLEGERVKVQHAQTQLESLKNQVNPHFLFNSLNTLSALIPQDPERAVDFVQRLSAVYRYVLEVNVGETISLGQELAFMEAYLFLLAARHGERLRVQLDIPMRYHEQRVIPLSLQILVENAVKHNVASKRKPLDVWISVEDGYLQVQNPLQRKRVAPTSTGLGLRNLETRYAILGPQEVMVREDDASFCVRLPLIPAHP